MSKEIKIEKIARAAAPNDHPIFIQGLADIVSKHLSNDDGKGLVTPKFLMRCPHCKNPRCIESKKWYKLLCS